MKVTYAMVRVFCDGLRDIRYDRKRNNDDEYKYALQHLFDHMSCDIVNDHTTILYTNEYAPVLKE